jgi:hypothetical protein
MVAMAGRVGILTILSWSVVMGARAAMPAAWVTVVRGVQVVEARPE